MCPFISRNFQFTNWLKALSHLWNLRISKFCCTTLHFIKSSKLIIEQYKYTIHVRQTYLIKKYILKVQSKKKFKFCHRVQLWRRENIQHGITWYEFIIPGAPDSFNSREMTSQVWWIFSFYCWILFVYFFVSFSENGCICF